MQHQYHAGLAGGELGGDRTLDPMILPVHCPQFLGGLNPAPQQSEVFQSLDARDITGGRYKVGGLVRHVGIIYPGSSLRAMVARQVRVRVVKER